MGRGDYSSFITGDFDHDCTLAQVIKGVIMMCRRTGEY